MDPLRPADRRVYLVSSYVGSQGDMTTGYLKCAADCVLPTRHAPTAEPSAARAA